MIRLLMSTVPMISCRECLFALLRYVQLRVLTNRHKTERVWHKKELVSCWVRSCLRGQCAPGEAGRGTGQRARPGLLSYFILIVRCFGAYHNTFLTTIQLCSCLRCLIAYEVILVYINTYLVWFSSTHWPKSSANIWCTVMMICMYDCAYLPRINFHQR